MPPTETPSATVPATLSIETIAAPTATSQLVNAVPVTLSTHVPTIAPYEQADCLKPPDDYTRVEVNGQEVNLRTLWMLERAQSLYGGPGDLLRVTQGSYTDAEPNSFGTHNGGGAVDISIRDPANPSQVLWNETDAMVAALRIAGFAAWYRAPGDLGPGSPAHIHAIAIGDQELSSATRDQLIGPSGYFRCLDGLSPPLGPNPDRHGGPIICDWMLALGYGNLCP
jgi:hypothetical protein